VKGKSRAKALTFAALMAAISNILSMDPLTIPLMIGTFSSRVHFAQLAIFLSGILAGPWAGLLTGAIGGLYMSYSVAIPFVFGGLALLGFSAGFFAKRLKLRPFFSSVLAWCVQAPYVFITDYLWFVSANLMPREAALSVTATILIKLTIEALVSSALSEALTHYIKRAGLIFQ
jgi:uncharacterized membrane protein